jgi:hypothetical protein
VSRWADAFAALSGCDTLDTMRHSGDPPSRVSQSVKSVTALSEPAPATDRALEIWGEAEEERAGVIEYDGNVPRAWAEGYARLHPDHPPGDVPLRRWQTLVDDCGRFLDGGWANRVAALGWGPLDLFGCDRERPFAQIDHAGLLWLVNGGTLVELNRNRAIIEGRTGARQTFRRRPVAVGEIVLAWELVR